MLSPETQNEIIELIGNTLRRMIVSMANSALCFSVLADECTDCSTTEQLSLSVRFVNRNQETGCYEIEERFLGYYDIKDMSGQGLATAIISGMKELGLNTTRLVGQGFDGAANMSGHCNGAQAHIQKECPLAVYVHCAAHCLNLSVNYSCCEGDMSTIFAHMEKITKFFNTPKRQAFLEIIIKGQSVETERSKLVAMCRTRWVERHESVLAFAMLYRPILIALSAFSENGTTVETKRDAQVNYLAISNLQFVVGMKIFEKYSRLLKPVSKQLQSPSIDLLQCCEHIGLILEVIKTDLQNAAEVFHSLFEESASK
jgi:hypothetical protein